jgi:regulator of protease activity HflC (stomatin/prohibitin superfamily)
MSLTSTISDSFDKIVSQKGSGAYVILGILVIILGFGFGMIVKSELALYLSLIAGIAVIISSFLMIIRQYERAIILRLGKYQRQVGPGIQTRIPFADNILVVDIRERVREFKAERMLTKDNVPVTIDAILRYRIIETKSKDAIINVQNF